MTPKTKVFQVILPTLGFIFSKSNNVGSYFYPYFQVVCQELQLLCEHFNRFCPDFQQIKTFGGAFAPPELPPPIPLLWYLKQMVKH